MLQIGTRRAEGGDLVDALLECHGRIRQVMAIARALAGAGPERGAQEIREAAARVRRYFTEALPRHVEDEDASIVPRLRGLAPEVDAALGEMSAEHQHHEAQVARLVALCRRLEGAPEELPAARAELDPISRALEADFSVHLEREEQIIFPAIRRLLGEEERAAIQAEMRQRRSG
jgi:iron-sulfur cluster repair protein YtfE (RIC family)